MCGYHRSYRSGRHRRSVGRERALEHIRQAHLLSSELGGSDKDVKGYFFSLGPAELSRILAEYERLYGRAARVYAEKTIPDWKSGRVHMSGMVAERLFGLLPKYMPLEQKYKLTESLWRHVGPSSRRTLYVNPGVPFQDIAAVVKNHLERDLQSYTISESMEKRFAWLSQGDVEVKQQLLNFLRTRERDLASESLRLNIPILAAHLQSAQGEHTHHLVHKLQVGKHEIIVALTDRVEEITETAPRPPLSTAWIWWVIAFVILLVLFNK